MEGRGILELLLEAATAEEEEEEDDEGEKEAAPAGSLASPRIFGTSTSGSDRMGCALESDDAVLREVEVREGRAPEEGEAATGDT